VNWLAGNNAEITYLPVDNLGYVDVDQLRSSITEKTLLVSVMHCNNEVGTIEPIEEIGKLCNERNIIFHTDACQSFTKVEIDVKKQNINLLSLNAHKMHGPKGVGALYIKKGTIIEPFLHGGGQELGQRAGTYNTPAIVGFGKATEIASEDDNNYVRKLRDYFLSEMNRKISGFILHGPTGSMRLCNNINFSIGNISGKGLFNELNKRKIQVSTGSACSSNKLQPSHVLMAMEVGVDKAHGAVRIGLSKWTTKEEIDQTIHHIADILKTSGG
jgi:cysteine desulfurase